jgi:hypothetical protein
MTLDSNNAAEMYTFKHYILIHKRVIILLAVLYGAQDRDQWQALTHMLINLGFHKRHEIY